MAPKVPDSAVPTADRAVIAAVPEVAAREVMVAPVDEEAMEVTAADSIGSCGRMPKTLRHGLIERYILCGAAPQKEEL